MQELKNQLSGEFDARLEELGATELISNEYRNATDGITKIADRIIEIEKFEAEQALKEKQAKDEKNDKIARIAVDVLKFAGGAAVAWLMYVTSLKYEEKGVIPTTQAGRKAFDKLIKF